MSSYIIHKLLCDVNIVQSQISTTNLMLKLMDLNIFIFSLLHPKLVIHVTLFPLRTKFFLTVDFKEKHVIIIRTPLKIAAFLGLRTRFKFLIYCLQANDS